MQNIVFCTSRKKSRGKNRIFDERKRVSDCGSTTAIFNEINMKESNYSKFEEFLSRNYVYRTDFTTINGLNLSKSLI